MKSVIAKTFCHAQKTDCSSDVKLNLHGTLQPRQLTACTPADFQTTLYELSETIKKSALLSRHMATEVLVYLVSDLDRTHSKERMHAVPIGYGLKGYSITAETTRKMMDDILDECYKGVLYAPVVSSDKIIKGGTADTFATDEDVYKSAKSMKKI